METPRRRAPLERGGKAADDAAAPREPLHTLRLVPSLDVRAPARFDAAEAADATLNDQLWQRGLAYYYSKRYAEAAKQFEEDVSSV